MMDFKKQREMMVQNQLLKRDINDTNVISAMLKIERHLFINENDTHKAYHDGPIPIGHEQTISQPYMVALMTQALELTTEDQVLEIGTGSGYQTAVLAESSKKVFTIERIKALHVKSKELLLRMGYENIIFKWDDANKAWNEFAPFDKIIVTANSEKIPSILIEQLKDNGIIVIPVGNSMHSELLKIKKNNNKLKKKNLCYCRFVPLLDGKQ